MSGVMSNEGSVLAHSSYPKSEHLKSSEERTIGAGIPFDVQWNAKEYMIRFNDFTINNKTFGGFQEFVRHLHQIGMHYVPIIDPGIDPAEPKGNFISLNIL